MEKKVDGRRGRGKGEREREREKEDKLRCGLCGQWCKIMLHMVNAFIRWDNSGYARQRTRIDYSDIEY